MADELFNRMKSAPDAKPARGKGFGLLTWLGITLTAFMIGILLMMYLVSGGYVDIQRFGQDEPQKVAETLPTGEPQATTASPSPTPSATGTNGAGTPEERVAEAVAAPKESPDAEKPAAQKRPAAKKSKVADKKSANAA